MQSKSQYEKKIDLLGILYFVMNTGIEKLVCPELDVGACTTVIALLGIAFAIH